MHPLILTVVFGVNPTEASIASDINNWKLLSNYQKQQQIETYSLKNKISIDQLNQALGVNTEVNPINKQIQFNKLINKINSIIENSSVIQIKSVDQITLGTQDGVGGVIEK